MKNFQELIVELNKFEKDNVKRSRAHMIKQMGHSEYKRMGLTKDDPLKAFDKVNAKLRSNPNNPNLSPRREAENVIKKFQDVEPGQKGAGNRVDPRTGKVSQYDVTKVRHDELRGVSKKKTADIQKLYKGMGDKMKSDLYKNIGGSQNRRLYQPPFAGTELERAARNLDMFPKTKLGSPTTANIPKGKIPEPPKPARRPDGKPFNMADPGQRKEFLKQKLKPPTTFKPPKGSVGAMRNVYKAKPLYKKVLTKIKNPKLALGAAAVTAGIAGIQALRKRAMKEDAMAAPTNNVGGGQIAGTVEAGDNPPVKKKKRYIYGGRGSRKMWMNNK